MEKKSIPKHIIKKLQKSKEEEKIGRVSREKKITKGMVNRIKTNVSSQNTEF